MNYKSLIKEADVRKFSATDLTLPSIPKDGQRMLQEIAKHFKFSSSGLSAYPKQSRFSESLEVGSHNTASSVWFEDRKIRLLVWPGDLVIDGDLIDDDDHLLPLLIVRGNLTVRSWLRGGMAAFVGGHVKASGFVVGRYNDSGLFVGGDFTAAGYLPGAKPYPEMPGIAPHQIAGKVQARKFSLLNPTNKELKAAFVDAVLTEDGEDLYLNDLEVLERVAKGQAVWR